MSFSPKKKDDSSTCTKKCIVCWDTLDTSSLSYVTTNTCNHRICLDCLGNYFKSILKDTGPINDFEHVQCPSPECLENYAVNEVALLGFSEAEEREWWCAAAITKSSVSRKMYCPFQDCGAIFIVDKALTKACNFSVCYKCERGFCVACQSRWHPGEIKIINDEKEMEKSLKAAEKNQLCRCPECNEMFDLVSGCSHITCSCGAHFCYHCGGHMLGKNYSICSNSCNRLSDEKLKAARSPMFVQKMA